MPERLVAAFTLGGGALNKMVPAVKPAQPGTKLLSCKTEILVNGCNNMKYHVNRCCIYIFIISNFKSKVTWQSMCRSRGFGTEHISGILSA